VLLGGKHVSKRMQEIVTANNLFRDIDPLKCSVYIM
jgi:hypothetical protein